VRAGDVVLARFRSMPDRFVLKRVERPDGDGWFLRSDNDVAMGDSRTHGVADVLGRVVMRWPRGSRVRIPRRVRRGRGHVGGCGPAVPDSEIG
jgi:hypothetical protein